MLVTVTMAVISGVANERPEAKPERAAFSTFPMSIGPWLGRTSTLGPDVLGVLKLDDYILADFRQGTEATISFYAAYYSSQRQGAAPHSPLVCMPGGGWQITDSTQRNFSLASQQGGDFSYNRAIIRNGDSTQLVYYWYQERGKGIASEYWAKWNLFRDALLMNRSDGALVRLVTPLGAKETEEAADKRLTAFATAIMPLLPRYIPN